MNSEPKTQGFRPDMPRRGFLALGSAGSLLPLLGASRSFSWLRGLVGPDTIEERISIAYGLGSETYADPDSVLGLPTQSDDLQMVPAVAIPAGDPRFAATGIRMTFHGCFPSSQPWTEGDLDSLIVGVHYPHVEGLGTDSVAFLAWGFRKEPVPTISSAVSFPAHVDRENGLKLSFNLSRSAKVPFDQSIRFTLGNEPHRPKLRRGIYFIEVPGGRPRFCSSAKLYLAFTIDHLASLSA